MRDVNSCRKLGINSSLIRIRVPAESEPLFIQPESPLKSDSWEAAGRGKEGSGQRGEKLYLKNLSNPSAWMYLAREQKSRHGR